MNLIVAGALGVASWTFAEYALHNWVGHLTRGRTEFSREHLAHHRVEGYFTPTGKKARTALLVLTPLVASLAFVAGLPGVAFGAGFAAMYVAYEVAHRTIHTHAPRGPYGRWARRHHLHHHHRNAGANHGVTTPIWDWVFGTLEPCARVRVPHKRAPDWMVDEHGALRPEYADSYELVGPAARAAR